MWHGYCPMHSDEYIPCSKPLHDQNNQFKEGKRWVVVDSRDHKVHEMWREGCSFLILIIVIIAWVKIYHLCMPVPSLS